MAEIDMPEAFSGKLGPLPVWAWGAIVGCGIVAYVWFSGRTDGSTDIADDTTSGDVDTATSGSVADAIDGAFKPGTASGSSDADDIPETVDSNTAWGLRATSYLVTQGISPVTAQRAINAYLNGDAMTADQSDLADKAIIGIGQPPSAVELNPTVPSAVPYSSYRRDAKGQIFGIKSTGSEVAISDTQYLSLGMPALTTDLYSWRYTKLGKAVPASSITSKFKITTERLMVLNRWKSLPELKKGMRVKVPA